MTPERFRLVQELFHAACEMPSAERADWLDRSCPDDPELRREVEALLQADARRSGAGEPPAALMSRLAQEGAVAAADACVRIGEYEILGRIGGGGMGIVYEARQSHPRRVVALKVLRPELASEQMLRRFDYEIEALAQFNHPGVAQIYDAGVATAKLRSGVEFRQPYIAMEYVRGRRLDHYLGEERPDRAAVIRLLAEICDAVHHAHQCGVIHRDLKPANVLVDDSGRPKVVDFGVSRAVHARAAAQTLLTESGQIVGTPAYMCPEQLRGDARRVDLRSDTYALGVVAYQALTGSLPFEIDGSSFYEAAKTITECEPRRPSRTRAGLDRDVELILLKALEKDPARRYQSAAALRQDLLNHLAGEPISARQPSLAYQLRMLANRHRASFIASGAVVAILIASLIVSTSYYFDARRARDAEAIEREAAQVKARIAGAVNDFLNDDLLAAASPDATPNPDIRMRDVLAAAAEKIDGKFPDDPLVEAAVRQTLGHTYSTLGDYARAATHLERSVALRRAHLPRGDRDVVEAANQLGTVYYHLGALAKAESTLSEVYQLAEGSLGPDAPLTISAMNGAAFLRMMSGRKDGVEELLTRSLERQRRVDAKSGDMISYLMNLAHFYLREHRPNDAEPHLLEAREIAKATLHPEHPQALLVGTNLAALYSDRREYDRSIPLMQETLGRQIAALGIAHPQTLITKANLGFALRVTRRLEEASVMLEDAYNGRVQALGPDHPHTFVSLMTLGQLRIDQGRFTEAEDLLQCCFEKLTTAARPDAVHRESVLISLVRLYEQQGRYREAAEWQALLVPMLAARLPPEHPGFITALERQADLIGKQVRPAD